MWERLQPRSGRSGSTDAMQARRDCAALDPGQTARKQRTASSRVAGRGTDANKAEQSGRDWSHDGCVAQTPCWVRVGRGGRCTHRRRDRRRRRRMSFHDLRSYLDRLSARDDLLEIDAPVDPVLESTALCLRALREQGPALLMRQATGSRHPLLGNLFGHRRRIELALGNRPLSSLRELGQLLARLKEPDWPGSMREALHAWPGLAQLAHAAPRRVQAAAFCEQVFEHDEVDLLRLPLQRCWPEDVGRLLTFGLVVTRGPQRKRQNVAIYRQQPIARNRLIMR